MLRAEDLQQAGFPDVRLEEQEVLQELRAKREQTVLELDLAKRSEQLQMASGFTDFVKTVQARYSATLNQMVTYQGSDAGLWELKGRAQAFNNLLAILTQAKSTTEVLEERLAGVENAIKQLEQRIPKPMERNS